MKFEKKQFVKDLSKGMTVNDIFIVKNKTDILKYSKGYRFEFTVGDKTGDILVKFWGDTNLDEVTKKWNMIKEDTVIYLEGRVNMWKDQLDIAMDKNSNIRILSPDDFYKKDFIEVNEKIEEDFKELKEYINKINNEILRNLLNTIFTNPNILVAMKQAPASYLEHYSYAGGLVKHTLNVVRLADFVSRYHTNIDRNILLAGAILHDIGRIKEFKIKTTIKQAKISKYENHEVIGIRILEDFYRQLNVPQDMQLQINHIILTHHTEPKTPEGVIVKYCNELDVATERATENEAVIKSNADSQ